MQAPANPSVSAAPNKRLFICYSRDQHAELAERIYSILKSQDTVDVYVENHDYALRGWEDRVRARLRETDLFIYLVCGQVGRGQEKEAIIFREVCEARGWRFGDRALVGKLVLDRNYPAVVPRDYESVRAEEIFGITYHDALGFARAVLMCLGIPEKPTACRDASRWYSYEKTIIDVVLGQKEGARPEEHSDSPEVLRWPNAERLHASQPTYPNPLPEDVIGAFRTEKDRVLVDARSIYHTLGCPRPSLSGDSGDESTSKACCLQRDGLTFAEAGPRADLRLPLNWDRNFGRLNVGIVVSGGIAPGINAVISGIVQRHLLYHAPFDVQLALKAVRSAQRHEAPEYQLHLYGYRNGFRGMTDPQARITLFSSDGASPSDHKRIAEESKRFADDPGSRLGTSRFDDLLGSSDPVVRDEKLGTIVDRLMLDEIHVLYVIGGDGTMRAAHAIWETAQRRSHPLSVVAVPKTMDNDILWVWQSFGFLSAVEKAREILRQLHVEVASNPRLGVCQLFGSDSGFVVSHAALASGVCDLALIPEVDFSLRSVLPYLQRRLDSRLASSQSPYALVAMAETAIPIDALEHPAFETLSPDEQSAIRKFFEDGRRIQGQTADILRQAGLNLFRNAVEKFIRKDRGPYSTFRALTNEPRHLLRTTEPSVTDVIFGQRLGTLAVDNAMAGYTDFMISQWMTEYVVVPLPLVTLGRKRVPPNGIFWKSVVAATGQPPKLV